MSRVTRGEGRGKGKRKRAGHGKQSTRSGIDSGRGPERISVLSNIKAASYRNILGVLAVLVFLFLLSFPFHIFFLSDPGELSIVYPFDGSLFPPEIIAPTIWWEDGDSDASKWHVTIEFESQGDRIDIDVDTTFWVPDRALWESIKTQTLNTNATITVSSLVSFAGISRTLSSQTISISTSPDSVGAPIFFREVPLPFLFANEHLTEIKWRIGNIGSYDPPPVILSDLPVCGNCHSFSTDGKTLGMDVDVGNDKGAYILTDFDPETVFSRDKIFSWYDYYPAGATESIFGLLARVSPDGRYVVGGMKDRAVFLPRPDLAYSQIFFPVLGSLAYYDRITRTIEMLPGADDDQYVQTNAMWTPDGQFITFARGTAPTLTTTPREHLASLSTSEAAEVLGGDQYVEESREGYTKFLYDLYTMPFNDGRGGEPLPLEGAAGNGKSNYFPKYSPDGEWLVFTQAESFMLLMPDSRLYIMPAEGGEPRLMNCNTESMNSWHSWSPNSRWLVFSSKLFSPYTQLFLTHVDENGIDTPPVLLKNFIIPERAANIPEFVNIDPESERVIEERFVDDYSYYRHGLRLEGFGRIDAAQSQYLESLRLNPDNTESRLALGITYANTGQFDKAEEVYREVSERDPMYNRALYLLGGIKAQQGALAGAVEDYRQSLAIGDDDPYFEASVQFNLGRCLFLLEDYDGAAEAFQTVLRIDPSNFDAFLHSGNIKIRKGDLEGALRDFESALELDPSVDSLREKISELRLRVG
ncbi:MAG: tetratricopeptide repeat protein [Longimicrobiales bacterium]|nr:tetratricopeptide repeat protein [Longimicrobiales bacterium]